MGMKKVHLCLLWQAVVWCDDTSVLEPAQKVPEHSNPSSLYVYNSHFCLHWNRNKMPSLGTVYGWIRGICNWKSWIKPMRLFQSVAAALLPEFLSIRQNTFDGIEQYLKQLIYIQLQFPPANTPDSPVWAHRVGRWSPIETAEDKVSDEVFLLCLILQVFTLHYLLFDRNAKTILF